MITVTSLPVNGASPSKVGGLGATCKIFPSPLQNPPGTNVAGVLYIPNNGQFEGRPFKVRYGGNVYVHGTSPTLNFLLQKGTSLTYSSNTTVLTLASAVSLVTQAYYPFYGEATFQGDSDSGLVSLVDSKFYVDNTSGSTETYSALSSISFTAGGTAGVQGPGYPASNYALALVFGVTFAVTDALNVGKLMLFDVEA